jgi:hypothetical protein
MVLAPPEAMNCWSEDTIERSVKSPATSHAITGTRVLTGRGVPVILIMAILPRIAPPDCKTSVEGLLFRLDRVSIGFALLEPVAPTTVGTSRPDNGLANRHGSLPPVPRERRAERLDRSPVS